MSSQLLSIGSLAEATNMSVSALRYWDDRGIIEAAKRVGGQRRFEPDTVGRVNFIQRCQETGFSLEQIMVILDDSVGQWQQLVDQKLIDLEEQRRRLDEMIDLLREVRKCGCQVVATCTFPAPCC